MPHMDDCQIRRARNLTELAKLTASERDRLLWLDLCLAAMRCGFEVFSVLKRLRQLQAPGGGYSQRDYLACLAQLEELGEDFKRLAFAGQLLRTYEPLKAEALIERVASSRT